MMARDPDAASAPELFLLPGPAVGPTDGPTDGAADGAAVVTAATDSVSYTHLTLPTKA